MIACSAASSSSTVPLPLKALPVLTLSVPYLFTFAHLASLNLTNDLSCVCTQSDVNGPQMNEVFAWLKSQPNGKSLLGKTSIGWNFEKVSDKGGRTG